MCRVRISQMQSELKKNMPELPSKAITLYFVYKKTKINLPWKNSNQLQV